MNLHSKDVVVIEVKSRMGDVGETGIIEEIHGDLYFINENGNRYKIYEEDKKNLSKLESINS